MGRIHHPSKGNSDHQEKARVAATYEAGEDCMWNIDEPLSHL